MTTVRITDPPLTRHQLGTLAVLLKRAARSFADPESREVLEQARQVADAALDARQGGSLYVWQRTTR